MEQYKTSGPGDIHRETPQNDDMWPSKPMLPQRLCVDHPLRLSRPVDTRIQHTATSETWSDYTSQSTWQPMEVGEEVIGIHPLDNTCRCALTVACQGRKNCNLKILRLAVVPAPAEDPSFWCCWFCRK